VKFTKEVPTVPGAYWWRCAQLPTPILADIRSDGFGSRAGYGGSSDYREWGGEWCRLVPVEEVEKAFVEACEAASGGCYMDRHDCEAWSKSRSKRVLEGKEEPTAR